MATTTTTGTSSATIPEELQPYFIGTTTSPGLLPTAQSVFSRSYADTFKPLEDSGLMGAGRVAGLTPDQVNLGQQIRNMQRPDQFNTANGFINTGGQTLTNLTNQQAATVNAPDLQTFQLGNAQTFGSDQANQYMSPFVQAALNPQLQALQRQNAIDQQAIGAKFAGSGAFGGGRQAIGAAQANAETARQMNQAIGTGYQNAFAQAQQQFERDRAAQADVNKQNLNAALGVQQLGSTQNMTAQELNQKAGLQAAAQRAEAARGLGNMAAQAGQLGTAQQATDIDRMKMAGAQGDLERSLNQQRLDARYEDVLRQIKFPEEQISGMSSILRGTPVNSTVYNSTQLTSPPSLMGQLANAGISGLSLYNLMQPK